MAKSRHKRVAGAASEGCPRLRAVCRRLRFEPHAIARQLDERGRYEVESNREFPFLIKLFHYTSRRHTRGATWHERLELLLPQDGPTRFRMGGQEVELAPALLLACGPLVSVSLALQAATPRLKVSDNQRFLVAENCQPFFWLGDTAWALFHRLNREEADRYLENRAKKGFAVIQAMAFAELDGLNTPNAYGHRPLVNNDPTKPELKAGPANDSWNQFDYIVDNANAPGLHIGFLPS